jgi:hypothetical protein
MTEWRRVDGSVGCAAVKCGAVKISRTSIHLSNSSDYLLIIFYLETTVIVRLWYIAVYDIIVMISTPLVS